MEWLAVDDQRVFDPHPVIDGKPDQHWGWIAGTLKAFYVELLERFPDSGWSGQNNPLDNDQEVK